MNIEYISAKKKSNLIATLSYYGIISIYLKYFYIFFIIQ